MGNLSVLDIKKYASQSISIPAFSAAYSSREYNYVFVYADIVSSAFFLDELEKKGEQFFKEARIIILGDKGVGKTSLARRLRNPQSDLPNEKESTKGVDITDWETRDEDINVHIWDFAGHAITHLVQTAPIPPPA